MTVESGKKQHAPPRSGRWTPQEREGSLGVVFGCRAPPGLALAPPLLSGPGVGGLRGKKELEKARGGGVFCPFAWLVGDRRMNQAMEASESSME